MRERERERNNTSERMTIKPKKGSWHLFNNCGKIIVNLLFVFSTRGAQLFSSYSLLINENFNYSPKVISFLSSSEEFSLAILVPTFLPLPIVFSFVVGASQTLILDSVQIGSLFSRKQEQSQGFYSKVCKC